MSNNVIKNNYLNTTTHSGIARTMVQTLDSYDQDSAQIFADAGLDAANSQGADQRVVSVAMQKVWRMAVTKTGDEAFGITFARQMHPAALQGLGFAWVASNTLRDAFMRLVRYYRLIASAGEIVLEEGQDVLTIVYKIPGPRGAAAPASLDAAMALFVQLCRFTRDDNFCPARVQLQRNRPKDDSAFIEFFRCDIEYEADRYALDFDRMTLDEPLPMANPELARASDQVIIDYLRRHDDSDIINKVRACIIDWLPSGTPSQETIARTLNTSPRTLQRKLRAHGKSFSELLDSIRRELAQQYLSRHGRSASEVAYLLGFTEPGNFARSFKRWTGQTPSQFQSDT